jgi:uncharacterized membrane protein YdbT with pleckstrin-like domain
MSYVDKVLIPGEQVQYRATRQRFGYGWVAVPLIACIVCLTHKWWLAGGVAAAVTVATAFTTWVRISSSEFAVTNKRVIVKVGAINRRTVELMLSKIEGVGVDQTLAGRMGNYGTVVITGTGGTRETFDAIADPLEFRRQLQAQLSRMEDDRLQALRGAPARLST